MIISKFHLKNEINDLHWEFLPRFGVGWNLMFSCKWALLFSLIENARDFCNEKMIKTKKANQPNGLKRNILTQQLSSKRLINIFYCTIIFFEQISKMEYLKWKKKCSNENVERDQDNAKLCQRFRTKWFRSHRIKWTIAVISICKHLSFESCIIVKHR